jgi:HSP20 family protein
LSANRIVEEEVNVMPEVAVKKTENDKAMVKQNDTGVARGGWDPFSAWAPSEFFSDPFGFMHRFSEEMDRSFARFLGRQSGERMWSPAIEVSESGGQLKVHAELPGLKPEDVHVEVADNQLVIQGERKYESEENQKGVWGSERRYGQFYRAIPLPEGANTEQAKAQFKNGVLEVAVPVPEQKSNRREIPVEASK